MVHIQQAIISGETEPHRLITQICPLALISQQLFHAHFMFPTLRIPHVLVMVYLHLYERFSEKHTLSDRIYRYRYGHWKNQPRQLNAKERRFTKALEKSTAPVECRRKAFYHCLACQCRKNTIGARVGIKGSKVSSFSSVNVCSARH